jgi:hypothetical protein
MLALERVPCVVLGQRANLAGEGIVTGLYRPIPA